MKAKSIGTLVGTIVLSVLFAIPSSALSLEQQYIRYDFDSDASQEKRVKFVDNKFSDFDNDGLDGVIFAAYNSGVILLEGQGSTIDNQVNNLKNNSTVENVQRIYTRNPDSAAFDYLWSQTELDPRGQASATSNSKYKRAYIYATVDSDADEVELMDEYHNDFASEGVGGAFIGGSGWGMVEGSGWGMMPTILEGPKAEVNDWIDKMTHDSRFTEVTVVSTTSTSTQLYPELWSHSDGDARDTTK